MPAVMDTAVRTVAEQVCDRLRSELLAGQHAPESPLREEEVAERFGVSRHPIRKVFQKLTLEGLLTAKANCGVVVAKPPVEHVEGLLTPLRVQLELYALKLAFPRLNADDRKAWEAIVRRMEHACEDRDAQAVLDHDAAFHQQLLRIAELESMLPLWQAIYGRMRDHHRLGNARHEDMRPIAYGHRRLIDSLFCGDLPKAAADWQSHLENGAFNIQTLKLWESEQSRRPKRRPCR